MKKLFIAFAALAALVSCQSLIEEWQPVLGSPKEPAEEEFVNYDSRVTHTIAQLKAMYTTSKTPVKIEEPVWIKGQVVSSDRTGNVYRELYIQDESGALDVKVGRSSMYSDYHLGQWIYIYATGLTLGEYDGTLQLGVKSDTSGPNADYEVAYIDTQLLIDSHIFKGKLDERILPIEVTPEQIKAAVTEGRQSPLWGRYVYIKDLTYGCKKGYYTHVDEKVFFFIYKDPNAKDKKASSNRFFFSDGTYSITRWAITKARMTTFLKEGRLDAGFDWAADGGLRSDRYDDPLGEGIELNVKAYAEEQASWGHTLTNDEKEAYRKTVREEIIRNAGAQSLSQYFLLPNNQEVAIRSSGYGRFADKQIPAAILGRKDYDDPSIEYDHNSACVIGLLSLYTASSGDTPQITFIEDPCEPLEKEIAYVPATDVNADYTLKENYSTVKVKRVLSYDRVDVNGTDHGRVE